ncbi:MAG: TatD family nuclease-associated radical SAM protein [Endomicrobiia bacterium]
MKKEIVYKYKDNLYLNITNRCPVRCVYCIKYRWNLKFRGYNLGLNKEPSVEKVIKELQQKLALYKDIKEIVFCGYGEPLLRWQVVKKVALWVKKNYPEIKVRINTNGLASAYKKINIPKQLEWLIDTISVSLNAHNERVYNNLHKTKIKYPFNKIINFIKQAKKYSSEVIITTILHPQIDIEKVKKIAKKLKVKFKQRKYLTDYEEK